MHYKETQYGFEYGDAKIQRTCSDKKKGWVALGIKSSKHKLEVYITKTGKIRVFSRDGEWFPRKEGREEE
jgi:hypothetical protein